MGSLHRMQHESPGGGSGSSIPDLARRAKAAAPALGVADRTTKDAALRAAAERLVADVGAVLAANATDVARAEADGTPSGVVDHPKLLLIVKFFFSLWKFQ